MSVCFPYKVKGEEPYLSANATVLAKLYNKSDPSFYLNVEMLFDTGAEISLAPASLADALNLVLTDGEPVTLYGVGGKVNAYIHYVGAKMGAVDVELPIAIAEVENVPILFGMYGPMDQFTQFILNNVDRELCLYTPVLKPTVTAKVTGPLGLWFFPALTYLAEYFPSVKSLLERLTAR